VKGNYQRALMIVMVFLVSILSPLTTPIEPVEAHPPPETDDPPVRVKVYLNHVYSTEDLDDGGFLWLGGDAELGFMSEVEHVGHGFSIYPEEIHWNMDQDDGPGIWGLGGNTDERVEITRSPCWDTTNPHDLDSDCDGSPDTEDLNDDNDDFFDVEDEYPNDPENNGKVGRQELVWNIQYQPPKLIYQHDECTPYSDVLFSYDVTTIDPFVDWWWYVEISAVIVAIGLLAAPTGGGSVAAGGAATMGGSFWMTGAAWTTVGIGAASVTASAWESFKENGDYLQSKVVDHKLEVGDNIIFPSDGFTANQGGPIGVNVTLEIEELYADTDYVNPANSKRPCTDFSGDIEDSEQEDDSDEEEEVGFQEARASVSDGFSQLRSLFASINESTSVNQEYWDSYYVKYPEEAPPINSSNSSNNTYFNHNAQQWIDTYYNYSAQRRILMTGINGDVGDVTGDWLERVTTVNPDDIYGLNMDLWYAEDLTEGGHYYDALSYYESAIMGAIDAIENAPPPPPSTVTIQAGGDDVPEDLFIEIYSGDCGDDCAEEDLVFVGEEGDSEVEAELESGEYTVVMISDGDVYSSDYLEVQSGGDIKVFMSDVGGDTTVLNLAFYIQGLIVAALPALVGFAGSRQYLERKSESSESELESSTTPLWIGVVTFLAIFFMMIG
jgi:hypothetical protein